MGKANCVDGVSSSFFRVTISLRWRYTGGETRENGETARLGLVLKRLAHQKRALGLLMAPRLGCSARARLG